jgi:predicted nucleic acid-binding protein
MIVVSDATPLNVLARIGLIESLPLLYGQVIIPPAVRDELTKETTPQVVRDWVNSAPRWLEVRSPTEQDTGDRPGRGERQAIALAKELKADRLLVDDDKARKRAEREGIKPIGTLGILLVFAAKGLCNLDKALDSLPHDFRVAPDLLKSVREQGRKLKN